MKVRQGNGSNFSSWPILGCGVGLRNVHYDYVLSQRPKVDWFEAISENYMDTGGRPVRILEKVREHYPVVLHGTSLSIASTDPLNQKYLERLKQLVDRIQPAVVSDHLCWCGVDQEKLYDLLPIPYTQEALNHVVGRVQKVQEFLGRRILIENVSTYVTYRHSEMPEWEFISEVAKRSGCGILLDLNNIYVNAFNHQFDPFLYLENIPGKYVGQFHLAGHTDFGDFLFDTHSTAVIEPVWNLYREALKKWGKISTLIEWDESVPEFPQLFLEMQKAKVNYEMAADASINPDAIESKKGEDAFLSATSEPHPPLMSIQRWFKAHVQPLQANAPELLSAEVLNPQRSVPGEDRLSVYADGYLARIHETLKEVYPAVLHIVGESVFSQLARGYAAAFTFSTYNLNEAGSRFKDFLSQRPKTRELPFLPDLARLEWLVWESFHAVDGESFRPSQLSGVAPENWEDLAVYFQPSVKIMTSEWPVLDLWAARKIPAAEINIPLVNRPQQVLISRGEDSEVTGQLIDKTAYTIMRQLMKRLSLGEVLEKTMESGDLDFSLQANFSYWVTKKLICRVEATPSVKPISKT